ncbi:hypothetical protein C1T28_18675 [Bacillus subtilis]|nr:hypothetical protein C1T25_14825 [Bacillus cereus]POO72734.1 hypothetical protein C1T28_18675 [Bacillus subtilis]
MAARWRRPARCSQVKLAAEIFLMAGLKKISAEFNINFEYVANPVISTSYLKSSEPFRTRH